MNIKLDRNIYEKRKTEKEKRRLIETSKMTLFQIILYHFKFISLSIFVMFDIIWLIIGIVGEKRGL